MFIGYPKETIGYTFYHRFEGKIIVAKNGSFLEKEFLSKDLSGRKLELDEVIEPSLELASSATSEDVPAEHTLRTMLLLKIAGRLGHVLLLNGTVILS
jgi:hypothetical protein